MQDNTTTIEIREDQRDALQERKQHDRESYKAVLDRLLADGDAQNGGEQLLCNNNASAGSVGSDAIMRKLEQIEGAQVDTVSEAMQLAEDATYDHEEILGRIDDLENALPRKVAQEVSR